MASVIYDSVFEDCFRGGISVDDDTFKAMLVSEDYVPDQASHARRSDITNEVSGIGYSAGGADAVVSISASAPGQVDVSLHGVAWPSATITARGAVYYKARGGAASDDELVAYIDFGSNIVAVAGLFDLSASTLRIQN